MKKCNWAYDALLYDHNKQKRSYRQHSKNKLFNN